MERCNMPSDYSMRMVFEYVKRSGGTMAQCVTEHYTIGYIIKGSCRVHSRNEWHEFPESCLYLLNRGCHLIESNSDADGVFEQVVIHFDRDVFAGSGKVEIPEDEQRFESVVLSAIMSDSTVVELAEQCYLSLSTFKRRFTERYGMPPHRWLLQQRLNMARCILTSTSISTSDLAAACGFTNTSHFIQSFKSHFGTTPQAMRRGVMLEQKRLDR